MICNKPTKKGTPCKMPLKNGKCPTHDSDLSVRNSKVAQAFKAKHPEEFRKQRQQAGHNGFIKAGAMHGYERVNEKARLYRLDHPSKPEQDIINALAQADVNHYTREYAIGHGAIDLLGAMRGTELSAKDTRAGTRFKMQCTVKSDKYSAHFSNWIHLGNSNKINPFEAVGYYKQSHPAVSGTTVFLPFYPDGLKLSKPRLFVFTVKWAYFRIPKGAK